jgi:hypothetical protein
MGKGFLTYDSVCETKTLHINAKEHTKILKAMNQNKLGKEFATRHKGWISPIHK